MGASPYWYFVNHQRDLQRALDELREREFRAGRYNPVIDSPDYPVGPASPAPGAGHTSIDEAREDAAEDGTRSILDIDVVADEPNFCTAAPLRGEVLRTLYGTTKPTRHMVEENMEFLDEVDRGHCVYIVTYKDDKPEEILFAGYSYD
jgi:hypothetical protein